MSIKQIEDLLDEFDFGRVQTVMKALNWTYFNSEEVPTISRIYRMAHNLLTSAYLAEASSEWSTSSGGFEVTRYMYPGDPEKYLTLKFVVAEWSNPCV